MRSIFIAHLFKVTWQETSNDIKSGELVGHNLLRDGMFRISRELHCFITLLPSPLKNIINNDVSLYNTMVSKKKERTIRRCDTLPTFQFLTVQSGLMKVILVF